MKRILEFIAAGQALTKAPACDFTGIAAGTCGYLRAHFTFSPEWAGCKKLAVFTCKGVPYPVPLVEDACDIPAEALTASAVQVHVIGRLGDGYQITTTVSAFSQIVSS